jgi:ornithine cyclodeaminase/alanine dehydrogenase-like protein (mu-crystallin family)
MQDGAAQQVASAMMNALGRAHDSLARFLTHVQRDQVALTGSAAIRIHLGDEDEHVGDLDCVATTLAAIAPSVTNDFLISHFHVPHKAHPTFMMQLVDPVAQMRLDVFPDLLEAIPRATRHHVGASSMLVLTPIDILRHKRQILATASQENPVDWKHLRHARALADFVGEPSEPVPASHFRDDVYVRNSAYVCERCSRSRSTDYPLAKKSRILEVLGYV